MNDDNKQKSNDMDKLINAKKIENFEKTLISFDNLLKEIKDNLHDKTNTSLSNSGFDILYVHKKILEAENDRLILKNSYENLLKSTDKFEERLQKMEENLQELTGGLNQVRMSLSKLTSEKQESQKKFSNIFWSIIVPIIVSIIIFILSLTFRSCSSTIFNDIIENKTNDYIEL